jgi:cytochrome c peroxidase
MKRYGLAVTLALLVPCGVSVVAETEEFDWNLPPWMEPPLVPADNPMTRAKVDLGRRLFYDPHLSGSSYISCSRCHDPTRGFADGRPRAVGVTGQFHPRNSPGLANVAYQRALTWANPESMTLEEQARIPLFSEHPIVEMGISGFESSVLTHFANYPGYPQRFAAAFPERDGEISFDTIAKALAAFQRTLISARSDYDRFHFAGQPEAMSAAALRGEALFFSERLNCGACHSGWHFTDAIPQPRFHNTGLYNLDGAGALPEGNQGLIEHTGRPEDMGRFRTPSLRNVALTAPYMHDGSIATLAEVIEHYAAGGRAAPGGSRSPLASPLIRGFRLTGTERADLIAFLESLTDRTFAEDPRHHTPFR